MKISILCTDIRHPVIPQLLAWKKKMESDLHEICLYHDKKDLICGDILFLVSCSQIIGNLEREKFKNVLVIHASDLPNDRGWSPHIWQILEGATKITVSLLEAQEPVDTGPIWLKTQFEVEGHELLSEINEKLFKAELELMSSAVQSFDKIVPTEQDGNQGTYRKRRTPEDSRLDINKTIAEQFDILRVADPDRYPAFIDLRGKRYLVKIEKI